jgi:hypothetical protein
MTGSGLLYAPYVGPTEAYAKLSRVSRTGRTTDLQPGFSFANVALSTDGLIYAIGRYSSHSDIFSVERLTGAGKVAWAKPLTMDGDQMAVGPNGTLYLSLGDDFNTTLTHTGTVTAYLPSGRVKWTVTTHYGQASLAIRRDGTILAAGQLGLTAISSAGKTLWTDRLGSTLYTPPSIAVDARGTAYVGSGDGRVRIVSSGGRFLGTLAAGPRMPYGKPEIAITANGRLLVVGTDGILRAYGA